VQHGTWHELLELIAAAVLVAAGSIFVALSALEGRRTRTVRVPLEPPAATLSVVTILAATLSTAAAAVHLAAAPGHVAELGLIGWGFVAAAAFQGAWALAWLIDHTPRVAAIGLAGNLALISAWAWTRTIGLPVGELAGSAEPIGTADLVTVMFEIALVAILAAGLVHFERRLMNLGRSTGDGATIAIVPAVGFIVLAATLGISVALSHDHSDGESRAHAAETGAPAAEAHSHAAETGPHAAETGPHAAGAVAHH
jgi:hypothetical protein